MAATPAAPAIFTVSGNGTGPGAILNEDYTVNSFSNPAAPGSVILVYATGFGPLSPPAADGEIATAAAPTTLTVSARIAGIPSEVTYAGAAPGLIAGVVQINVRIPKGAGPNPAAPILLSAGSAATPAGVTVALQ